MNNNEQQVPSGVGPNQPSITSMQPPPMMGQQAPPGNFYFAQSPALMANPAYMQAPPAAPQGMPYGVPAGMPVGAPPGAVPGMQPEPPFGYVQSYPLPASKPGLAPDPFSGDNAYHPSSDPDAVAIDIDMGGDYNWSVDGVDVADASDLGHCCAAFWLPSCYVGGLFCGGRVNKCGLLTVIVTYCVTLVLLLIGLVSTLALFITASGENTGVLDFSYVVTGAYGFALMVYAVVMKRKAEADPHFFITERDSISLLTLGVINCAHFLTAGMFMVVMIFAVGLFASTLVLQFLSTIFGIAVAVIFIMWAHEYYHRMTRIRNVDGKEVMRWKVMSFEKTESPTIIV